MEQGKIDRINELARLAKTRELTAKEFSERGVLRKEYLAEWRQSTEASLQNMVLVDEKGNKRHLKKKD